MAMAKPWNPMEDAYKNKNFNKYTQGPGAEFDENLQPGAMASRGGGGKPSTERRDERFQLCLKMVPADMTEKAILQLCGHYGQVADIKRTAKTPFVFASFATLNDMERALEGLRRDKPQGIMVDVSKHTAEKLAANPNSNSRTGSSGGSGGGGFDRKSDKDRYSDSGSNSQPDMSKRTIKGPFANPERKPLTERKPFVTEADYQNSDLKIVDPDRQCLVERDMHDHDRNNRHNEEDDEKGGRKMYTGRAYYTDSKETTENLKRLAAGSKGSYNAEKDEFVKSSSQFNQLADEIHHCNLCQKIADKICQRCGDYYCSLDCQRKDWARHRLICFPMPQLVDPVPQLPPSNLTSPSANRPVQNNANQENRQNNMNQNQNRFQKDQSHSNFNNKNDNQNKYQKDQPQNSFNNRSNFDGKREQNSFDNRRDQTQKSFENRKDHAQNSFENRKDHAQNSFENRKDHAQNSFENRKTQGNDMFDGKKDQVRNSFDKKPNQSNDWGTRNNVSSENKKTTTEPPAAAKPLPPKPVTIQRADYPKSGSPISITAVIRPNKVYIRSMLPEDNVEYVKTINLVNNEAKTAKTLTELPKKGDVVITDFHGEGFFRACVLNAESVDRIMVAYIDFGNVDFKKLSELKEIPRELIGHKRQALALFLKDVEDFEPIEKITEFMNTYVECVGKDMKLVYSDVPDKGALTGELIEISTNESFNKAIVKMRNIEPAKLSDDPVFSKDIKMKVLPPGENVELIVLDNSLIQTGAITCVLGSDLGEIDKMTAQFADYVKNTKGPYTPRPQEICLVQYDDGLWYRAECIEVVGDQNPSVLFTDFGNLTTAHIDKIRKYPKELIVPCVSITCLLAGMPEEIGKTLADRLKELIPANEKIVACKVEAVDDQTNAIHLDSVVKALKTEKLI